MREKNALNSGYLAMTAQRRSVQKDKVYGSIQDLLEFALIKFSNMTEIVCRVCIFSNLQKSVIMNKNLIFNRITKNIIGM